MEERNLFPNTDFNGFYCNWRIIQECYESHHMAVVLKNNFPIGFAVWLDYSNIYATIEIVEFHYLFRKKGYGKLLTQQLISLFRTKGEIAVDLKCAPFKTLLGKLRLHPIRYQL